MRVWPFATLALGLMTARAFAGQLDRNACLSAKDDDQKISLLIDRFQLRQLIPMSLDAGLILGAIGGLMLTHFLSHGYAIAGEAFAWPPIS